MPQYFREETIPEGRDGFKSFDEMTHFLYKATPDEWDTVRQVSLDYLQGKRVPPRKLKKRSLHKIVTSKHGHHLLPSLHHEQHAFYEENDIGGGIIETISTIGSELSHILGGDWLSRVLGITPKTKLPQTLHSELIAYLTNQTYTPLKDRKKTTVGYTRLEKYDNEKFGVYQNDKSNELVVVVRGSKLNWSDIVDDMRIVSGMEPESQELDKMLDKLEADFPNVKYDIAGHSLGTMYIFSEFKEHREHMDDIFMFNPASSPLQSVDMLKEYGNDVSTWYMVNTGDVVSNALYQQMSNLTFDTQVSLGAYSYSILAAHSMSQWFPEDINKSDELPPKGPDYDNPPEGASMDIGEYGQDTSETQEAGLS